LKSRQSQSSLGGSLGFLDRFLDCIIGLAYIGAMAGFFGPSFAWSLDGFDGVVGVSFVQEIGKLECRTVLSISASGTYTSMMQPYNTK
jgi:hypothetical protein